MPPPCTLYLPSGHHDGWEKPKKQMTWSQQAWRTQWENATGSADDWAESIDTLNIMGRGAGVHRWRRSSVSAKEKRICLDYFLFQYGSNLPRICQCFHGDEMATKAFKQRIYQVKVTSYFLLKPSIDWSWNPKTGNSSKLNLWLNCTMS